MLDIKEKEVDPEEDKRRRHTQNKIIMRQH